MEKAKALWWRKISDQFYRQEDVNENRFVPSFPFISTLMCVCESVYCVSACMCECMFMSVYV